VTDNIAGYIRSTISKNKNPKEGNTIASVEPSPGLFLYNNSI
jgi:hypothetical protein